MAYLLSRFFCRASTDEGKPLGTYISRDICSLLSKHIPEYAMVLIFCSGIPKSRWARIFRRVRPAIWEPVFTNRLTFQHLVVWMAKFMFDEFLLDHKLQKWGDQFEHFFFTVTSPWRNYQQWKYLGPSPEDGNWDSIQTPKRSEPMGLLYYDYGETQSLQWANGANYVSLDYVTGSDPRLRMVITIGLGQDSTYTRMSPSDYCDEEARRSIDTFKKAHKKIDKRTNIKLYWRKWLDQENHRLQTQATFEKRNMKYMRLGPYCPRGWFVDPKAEKKRNQEYYLTWLHNASDEDSEFLMFLYEKGCRFPKPILKHLRDQCPSFSTYLDIRNGVDI